MNFVQFEPTAMDTNAEGTFLVTHADCDSAVLRNVETGQVHTISSNPTVAVGDVVRGTLAPEPPLEMTWQVVAVEDRRSISLEQSDESPTAQVRDLAAEQEIGELTRAERAGTGEVHVITVPPGETESTADDVLDDEATLSRAARLGVARVEVRTDDEDGVVSVRYLP